MDYFYVKPEDVAPNSICIRNEESKHLVRVLRKKIGDRIFAADGNDTMYEALISDIGKSETHAEIVARHSKYHESNREVTLGVSILKNPARFDYMVEKATELGVRTVIPLICENTIPRHEKHQRLENIALAAMKQCGRSWLPRIQMLQSFDNLLNISYSCDVKLIPHEKADLTKSIPTFLKNFDAKQSILVIIGPEGGFSEEEIHKALASGFKSVSLGTRRLRTDTAAVVALSQIL